MHISDSNHFVNINTGNMANFAEFICKSYIHITVCVLNNFCHLGSFNICEDNFPLTKEIIFPFYQLTDTGIICTNSPCIISKFANHTPWNNSLWGMDKMNFLSFFDSIYNRANINIYGSWRDR